MILCGPCLGGRQPVPPEYGQKLGLEAQSFPGSAYDSVFSLCLSFPPIKRICYPDFYGHPGGVCGVVGEEMIKVDGLNEALGGAS